MVWEICLVLWQTLVGIHASFITQWFNFRNGTNPVDCIVTVTQGLTLWESTHVSTTSGINVALETATQFGGFTLSVTTEIIAEITSSLGRGSEEHWSVTEERKYTVPAGKNFRVKQIMVDFTSMLPTDNLSCKTSAVVEETDGDFED